MLFISIITLLTALSISTVAAFVSVTGMMAIFPAAAAVVMVLMTSLEIGKLVSASWLKLNWSNPAVNTVHKWLMTAIVAVLMAITSLGMYGFLSKGYLEQSTPVASTELQVAQKEAEIKQLQDDNSRLQKRLDQLDADINSFLKSNRADRANTIMSKQKTDRREIEANIKANDDQITKINQEILPLKLSASNVEAKLGPIKYVAKLFGWKDPSTAVIMVILMLIFVSDPLAVQLLLASQISFIDWSKSRKQNVASSEAETMETHQPILDDVANDEDSSTQESTLSQADLDSVRAKFEYFLENDSTLSLDAFTPPPPREPIIDMPARKKSPTRRKPKAPEVTPEEANAAYQSTLRRLAVAYQGGEQQVETPTLEERKKLIEILEKQPELLSTIIDVVRDEEKSKVQIPNSEVFSQEGDVPPSITTNASQDQVTNTFRGSWLDDPQITKTK